MQPNNQDQSNNSIDGVRPLSSQPTINNQLPSAEPSNTPTAPTKPSDDNNPTHPALSAPTNKPVKSHDDFGHKKSNMMSILISVLLIIVLAGGIYGMYYWQHNKVNTLTSQVNNLNGEVSALQTKVNNNVSANIASGTSANTTQNIFKMPELGIELTVPTILADLSYAANSTGTSVNLSTQSLSSLTTSCMANESTNNALGSISKASGQFPSNSSSTTTLIKQYSTYYIAYTKPTSACSTDASITSFMATLTADLKNSFTTIETIATP